MRIILLALVCIPMMVACGTAGPAFGQPGASVTRLPYAPAGIYTFNFKAQEVYESSVYRPDAVLRYLQRNQGVLPPGCAWGLVVLEVIDGESGDSAASFRCNHEPIQERSR